MKPPFKRITICGVGLIGGSLGLATKRAFPGTHIIGIDRSRRALRTARDMGAIDTIADDWADALRFSSLIILATPVKGILEWLPRLGAYVSPGTVVSDAGSTKTEILAAAARVLPASVHFIGGHPMAGKAVSGAAQADPALFRGATYTLCPGAHQTDGALRRLRRWVRALGARPLVLDAATHDRLAAYVSHLPQLLSTALANLITQATPNDQPALAIQVSAGAFRDMIRLAASPYAIWGDIAETNREAILNALDEYIRVLQNLKGDITRADLKAEFAAANRFYRRYARWKHTTSNHVPTRSK